ncbi:MAG: hypothetical protein GX879_09095 [Bacteroidales bacterium]|nr:hypothetical protein [Bacteroidales bacterium]
MSEKNYDPKMHTAEHILNQTMLRMFNCGRAFGSHIERKKSKCDYRFKTPPSDSEIAEVEKAVNKIISDNLQVYDELVNKNEALKFVDLSKLPENTPDIIRVVRVGDYDACACIGPHVSNTSEIGRFKITTYSFNDGVLRIRFKLEG